MLFNKVNIKQETNKSNEKKENVNDNKIKINNSLSIDESLLLTKILEEYNDLFPEIMQLKKEDFLPLFQRYIQIYFASKNILFSIDTLNKIISIILNEYYLPEKDKINDLISLIDKNSILLDENNKIYTPHCYKTRKPIHVCGEEFYILENGKYYYCLRCQKIYEQKFVLLFCENCKKEYYSEIKEKNNILNINKIEYKLKPATWVKYHCNVSMNDTMKCPKCHNNFYLNMKNRLLCIKCNYEIDPLDIMWKCQICREDFNSEAKEYNPLEFRVMKLAVKKTFFYGIEAKPPLIPCCIISQIQLETLKFMHKRECNGLLYEGILDNQKIVVCLKCKMINFYNNHLWMCPLCKKKFNLYNNYENIDIQKNKSDKKNYFQSEKYQKRYKKYIRTNNGYDLLNPKLTKKKWYNYVKFSDEIQPKSHKNNDINKKDIDTQDLSIKKYKSAANPDLPMSKYFYNKTDDNNNVSKFEYKNIYNNEKYYKNNDYNKLSKNKSLLSKSNREYYPSKYNKNEEDIKLNNKEYVYSKEKQNIYNNSSKNLKMMNFSNDELKEEKIKKYIYKKNFNSNKNNNIKSMYNIKNNHLSNININLNVNVNINNNQKEKLLKSMSSYNFIQKNSNLLKENKNMQSYSKRLKNISIDLSKNIPISSLSEFDIDDYNIVKSIGEGTFGKIFEVEDRYHRHFAMKKLMCNSIKEIEILKKEYEYLYNFENLNIDLVKIYGIETKKLDRTTFVMYVLMELAKTDWEKEIIKRKKTNNYYSEKELIIILKNLVRTLSQLQQKNISHRDIKPQNILICENDRLKISDFGEAKENIENYNDTRKQTIRGTELYMSPALFKSLKQKRKTKYTNHNTYKSDVFSLGYCMLLAATLNFDCLYSIREIINMNLLKNKIDNFIGNRYSNNLIKIILAMLEIDEKERPDFIQLEKIIKDL